MGLILIYKAVSTLANQLIKYTTSTGQSRKVMIISVDGEQKCLMNPTLTYEKALKK